MKGLAAKLIGNAEHVAFEERIFNFSLLGAIFMTSIAACMDIFYYETPSYFNLAFLAFWILMFYLSRFKGCFRLVSFPTIAVLVFIFFPYNWIFSSGIFGMLPYYNIVFIAILCVLLSGKQRIIIIVSMLVTEFLLASLDAYQIGSFTVKITHTFSVMDRLVHLGVIMVAMAVLTVGYSVVYKKEKSRSDTYAETIEEQYKQQLYYMESLEEVIFKLKSERHDFNNNLGVIYGLLGNGETDKATDYTAQLVKTAEEYRNIVNIPYSMLRAMLNYKLSGAAEDGIELRLNINIPAGLPLSEFDITVILGNLLDNAVEACKKVEEDKRYISVELTYKPDYLVIQIENPTNGNPALKDGAYRTTKPDSENHGFGLNSITYLVSRHNGLMKIEADGGVFKVNIALLAK